MGWRTTAYGPLSTRDPRGRGFGKGVSASPSVNSAHVPTMPPATASTSPTKRIQAQGQAGPVADTTITTAARANWPQTQP